MPPERFRRAIEEARDTLAERSTRKHRHGGPNPCPVCPPLRRRPSCGTTHEVPPAGQGDRYSGVLHAELRDAAASTHDSVRRLVVHCGGEVVSIEGTILRARPGLARSDGELLMRRLLVDPAVIPESVGWS